jgi:transposase-like protein
MNSHKNAPLTPKGREAMVRCVEAGLSKAAAARQFNVTPKIVAKWVERFRASGVDGFARPLLQASFIAEPNGACHMRGH